jgi:hypothetical protein
MSRLAAQFKERKLMSNDEFVKQQYLALRKEIDDSTSRIFWLLILGMVMVMVSGYMISESPSSFGNIGLPFFLLAILIAFVNEQNNVSRAGKYLREVIEPNFPDVTGWEEWLKSKSEYRETDRAYFISFSTFFLILFAISASLTLTRLNTYVEISPEYLFGTIGAYTLSGLCVLFVVVRHWRSSTSL